MQIGISTACLYPRYTELALEALLEAGERTVEVFLNAPSEARPDYLRRLRAMADGYGARIVSVHPYSSGMEGLLFFTGYDRRFDDGVELYKGYFEAAGLLGAGLVVFHGAYRAQAVELEDYARRYARLDETARAMGCLLAHENVERCAGREPGLFEELGRLLPQARFVLDVKQAVRAGVDPFDMLEAMGERTAHIHLSDNREGFPCLPPGSGSMALERFFDRLLALGFTGDMVVELYQNNYQRLEQLVDSRRYAQALWARCKNRSTSFDRES